MAQYIFYFSTTGNTLHVVKEMREFNGTETKFINITTSVEEITTDKNDICFFAVPVYAGRVPFVTKDRLSKIKGTGPAAIITTYGSRDYDDALLELQDLVNQRGYNVIGAAAFPVQHNLYNKLGKGRPDNSDIKKIDEFSRNLYNKLKENKLAPINDVKGARPYKSPAPLDFMTPYGSKKCTKCMVCIRLCPAEAISKDNPRQTDKNKCIKCILCVVKCPEEARKVPLIARLLTGLALKKYRKIRKEPETFL